MSETNRSVWLMCLTSNLERTVLSARENKAALYKAMNGLCDLSYEHRLKCLHDGSLETERTKTDLVMAYKS